MPTIKDYDTGNLTLQPTERGVDARLQAARRIAAFGNQAAGAITGAAEAQSTAAGDVARAAGGAVSAVVEGLQQQEKYAGQRAISQGAPAAAKLYDNLDAELNARVSEAAKRDPNDPTVAQKFREEVLEPKLEEFKDAYSGTDLGQKWAEQRADRMRDHFWQKSAADTMTLAAKAVETNITQLGNVSSNTAFRSPDHHTVKEVLANYTDDVGHIVEGANVKGAEAARIFNDVSEKGRKQIIQAGASGAIAKSANPEATAQEWADRYPEYISGADAKHLAAAAKTQAKTNLLQDKQIEDYRLKQEDRAVHTESAKVMLDNVSFDENGKSILKPQYFPQMLEIARRHPDAPSAAATVHAAITWGEHQQNQRAQATVSDPAVKSDLYTRLFDPTNPTTEIDLMKANVAGKLSTHDFAAMHQLQKALEETPLKGEVMKDTLAAAKAALTYSMPGMPGRDPKGLANYSAFIQSFVPKYISMNRAGTLPANALDTRDPASLISQSMAPFKRSAKQIMDDRVAELSSLNLTADGKTITGISVTDLPPAPAPKPPEVGFVKDGYRFKGGNPAKRESWEKL